MLLAWDVVRGILALCDPYVDDGGEPEVTGRLAMELEGFVANLTADPGQRRGWQWCSCLVEVDGALSCIVEEREVVDRVAYFGRKVQKPEETSHR